MSLFHRQVLEPLEEAIEKCRGQHAPTSAGPPAEALAESIG
jgi:hypothetical protein